MHYLRYVIICFGLSSLQGNLVAADHYLEGDNEKTPQQLLIQYIEADKTNKNSVFYNIDWKKLDQKSQTALTEIWTQVLFKSNLPLKKNKIDILLETENAKDISTTSFSKVIPQNDQKTDTETSVERLIISWMSRKALQVCDDFM